MKGTAELATELHREFHESQNERDKRIEELWKKLNPSKTSALDLKALQRGLKRIEHPLANADDMLQRLMRTVDTNGDGKIQYEEFRSFVDQAEGQLLNVFRSINTNHDGRLDKKELQSACRRAGVAVPTRRLDTFFREIDGNADGYITFEEWRDFLLFMPAYNSDDSLNAIFSFYSLTSEGDSLVSDETLEGLGTSRSPLYVLFGSIIKLFSTPADQQQRYGNMSTITTSTTTTHQSAALHPEAYSANTTTAAFGEAVQSGPGSLDSRAAGAMGAVVPTQIPRPSLPTTAETGNGTPISTRTQEEKAPTPAAGPEKKQRRGLWRLTDLVPDPGYFLAGAIAGGVSRTATAPLDRLKVHLLVNTAKSSTHQHLMEAVKGGHLLRAMGLLGSPFRLAVRDLWAAGGARTFFAGNGLNVLKIMPETAIKFGSYEAAKRAMSSFEGHGDPRRISAYSKFAAGGVAGMIAQFCVYPLDTLKFRLQCEITKDGLKGNALVLQTARKMVAEGGVRVAYRGVTMGLVGMFPYSAIDMGTFEFLKSSYKRWEGKRTGQHPNDVVMGNLVTGVMGASSGAFGASIVYPLNVLRTRLQTQGTAMHRETYDGIVDVARKTVSREGWRGLYKGLTPNLLKVAPALSITWMVYEKSKRVLGLE